MSGNHSQLPTLDLPLAPSSSDEGFTVLNSVLTHIFHWLVCGAKSARSRAIVLDLSAGWAKVGPEGCGAGCVEVVTCWGSRAQTTCHWAASPYFL